MQYGDVFASIRGNAHYLWDEPHSFSPCLLLFQFLHPFISHMLYLFLIFSYTMLHADVTMLRADVTMLRADVTILCAGVMMWRADVTMLRDDVKMLCADVTSLRADVTMLCADVTMLRADVTMLYTNITMFQLWSSVTITDYPSTLVGGERYLSISIFTCNITEFSSFQGLFESTQVLALSFPLRPRNSKLKFQLSTPIIWQHLRHCLFFAGWPTNAAGRSNRYVRSSSLPRGQTDQPQARTRTSANGKTGINGNLRSTLLIT